MEYSKIIAVTGLPGLQELISSKNDGAIIRSLEDNVTKFVSSRIHNFSHLESIEIYTVRDNVNLVDIFHAMEKSNEPLPDEKNANTVKGYFEKVYPEIDFERVYNSDMKKMVKWFSVLKANSIEIKLTEVPEEEEEVVAPAPVKKETATEEKPKKATAKKKEEKPAATKEASLKKKDVTEKPAEAPKKKAVAKPKKEEEKEVPKKKAAPKKNK